MNWPNAPVPSSTSRQPRNPSSQNRWRGAKRQWQKYHRYSNGGNTFPILERLTSRISQLTLPKMENCCPHHCTPWSRVWFTLQIFFSCFFILETRHFIFCVDLKQVIGQLPLKRQLCVFYHQSSRPSNVVLLAGVTLLGVVANEAVG